MNLDKFKKLKKNDRLLFDESCFAFKKADYKDGCKILVRCKCNNCHFYKTKKERQEDLEKYPFTYDYARKGDKR